MNSAHVDLLIRIKNGYLSRREQITSPYSKFRGEILKKLKELGYISDYEVEGDTKKTVTITLKYDHSKAAFTDVKIFSTPGRRWYVSAKEVKPVLSGLGHAVYTTPKGIVSNLEAKKSMSGGELLFEIW